jgi:hypothetical protein
VERLNVGTIISLPSRHSSLLLGQSVDTGELRGSRCLGGQCYVYRLGRAAACGAVTGRARLDRAVLSHRCRLCLLPLNVLTTDRHLGVSLLEGDWVMAGFDLTMLAFGAAFATVAWMLILKRRAQGAGSRSSSRALVAIQYARATE